MGGDFSSIVHSKISKCPKMLSNIQFSPIQDQDFSRHSRTFGNRSLNRKYGTTLVTRIPTDTFYFVNKISPKSIETDDLLQGETDRN